MSSVREEIDQGDGSYDFDGIDGYEEMKFVVPSFDWAVAVINFGYSDHPELQAKVRRCVEQGHIDPEDFKGVSPLSLPCVSV